MAFREAPVPAVVVLDEQDLGVAARLVEDDAAAGFFIETADVFELDVFQLGQAPAQLRLIEDLAVGGHDRTRAGKPFELGDRNDDTVKIIADFLARHHIGALVSRAVCADIGGIESVADVAKERNFDIVRDHCAASFR